MRWFLEVWDSAGELKAEGVDIRGVTAWAFFGLHGWDQLCAMPGGNYEVGIYDARSSPPRATAMASMLKTLNSGGRPAHPLVSLPGWWKRDDIRLQYGHAVRRDGSVIEAPRAGELVRERVYRGSPLLIATAECTRQHLAELCRWRNIPYRTITPAGSVVETAERVRSLAPWAAVVDDSAAGGVVRAACEVEGIPVAHVLDGVAGAADKAVLNEMLDGLIDGASSVTSHVSNRRHPLPA
jgi:dTDP-4-dehydrorhamnose reductase